MDRRLTSCAIKRLVLPHSLNCTSSTLFLDLLTQDVFVFADSPKQYLLNFEGLEKWHFKRQV